MNNPVSKVSFAAAMCLLGAAAAYLVLSSQGAGQSPLAEALAAPAPSQGHPEKYNGPPCMDEQDVKPGQPKPYCGDLPSLAALNIREAKLEKIAGGFKYPWAMEFISDDEILVTEFAGKLSRVDASSGNSVEVSGLPEIASGRGQTGLLDVALHPQFQQNGWIYLSYVIEDNNKYALAVAKAELQGTRLKHLQQIFVALPFGKSASNFGGALLFDHQGYLYISTGDRSVRSNAQHPSLLTGKIIRLNDDGSIPDDNPFVGKSGGVDPAIYALGVRNPQGLVQDSATGSIYETEHGPMGGDEINLIEAGKNYGWPIITYGLNYTYRLIGEGSEKEGYEQPLFYYLPSVAVSPIEIYRGDMFREWHGDLLVGALKGAAISKLDLVNGRIQSEYKILGNLESRIRDIKVAPDSSIWVLLQTGSIYRLSREDNPVQKAAVIGQRSGETIYLSICSSCHSQDAPDAPQISKGADWTERLQKPRGELYRNSIDGFNSMPEKGFCDDCTDDEIIRAVNFMFKQINR
jgi:glucose/arabinose dehydrogenase